jgi:L-ascorbate metabolism protein UlaG (beta-lactamase superfamily)
MLLGQDHQTTFLIDPFFKPYNFPVKFPPPAIEMMDVPDCRLVLVTHGDFDHFDLEIVRRRWPNVPVIVPPGLEAKARRQGAQQVVPLPVWKTHTHSGLTITAVPAEHRGVPACGYVIASQAGKRFYTAGDTLWVPDMKHIPERCGKLDAAFIPVIGIRMWGRQTIWSPAEAAQAMATLKPGLVVPVHLDAFIHVPLVGGMFGSIEEFETALVALGASSRVRRMAYGEEIVV